MALSGVSVDDACIKVWQMLKTKKIKCANFMLTKDMTKIVVDENSIIQRHPREACNPGWFEAWCDNLPDRECRYSCYDVEIGIDLGSGLSVGNRSKLVFVIWAPTGAKIKEKMVSASSKEALKQKFDGVQIEWQFNDASDYEAQSIIADLNTCSDIKTSGAIKTFEGKPVNEW